MSRVTEEQRFTAAVQRIQLLASRGREDDALEVLAEQLSISADNPQLLALRAWLLNRLNRTQAALESAQAALRIAPEHKLALDQTADAYLRQRDYDQAEQVLSRMLESWPDDADLHQRFASAIARSSEDRAITKVMGKAEHERRRVLAYAHFTNALRLAPDDPWSYHTAAHVVLVFGAHHAEALRYLDRGLALAPENVDLLHARSVALEGLTAASNQRGSLRASHIVAVTEADRILRLDPENSRARQRVFAYFWRYRTTLIDTPLIGLTLILFNATLMFVNGHVIPLFPGLIVAALFTAFRVVRYRRIASKVSASFRRSVIYGTSRSRLRIVLSSIAWTAMLFAGASLLFVRDAVVLRWLIVALAASLIWYSSFDDASERRGGRENTSTSFQYSAEHRRQLVVSLVLRGLLAGVAVVLLIGPSFREDARSMMNMAFASTAIPPLSGLIVMGLSERRRAGALSEETALSVEHRAPRLASIIVAGGLASIVTAVLVLNLVRLPVLPNEYDMIGLYTAPAVNGIPECGFEQSGCDEQQPEIPGPNIPTYEPPDLDFIDLDKYNPTVEIEPTP